MNYQKIYDDICKRGQERQLPKDVYTEKHHIVPKCLGGTNEKSNLTVLTAREHFLVHYILASKIYKSHKGLWNALNKMLYSNSKGQRRYIPNSKFYQQIKQEISIAKSGKGNHFYGKKHSDETKTLISEKRNGKYSGENSPNFGREMSQDSKEKISKSNKGKKRSDEIKIEISNRTKGELNPFFGKKHTEETKAIIREKRALQVFSKETCQKMSDTRTGKGNHFYGKKHSEVAIEKMRKNKPHLRKCSVDGILYISIAEVARLFGISNQKARRRFESTKDEWKEWIFINSSENF